MDIGSSAFRHQPDEMWAAGATGNPTRTLIRYLIDHSWRERAVPVHRSY
jgi:hypothetical protein